MKVKGEKEKPQVQLRLSEDSRVKWIPSQDWGFFEKEDKNGPTGTYKFDDGTKFVDKFLSLWTVKSVDKHIYLYDDANGTFDIYNSEIYSFIHHAFGVFHTSIVGIEQKVNAVLNILRSKTTIREENFKSPYSLINLKNGVLDLNSMKLLPHDPKYNFLTNTPIDYNPSVGYDRAKWFVSRCVGDENERTIQETLGYIFVPGYPIKQFIRFHGKRHSGKSSIMDIVGFIVGRNSVSTTSLRDLCDPRKEFKLCTLYGKKINISPEENNLSFDDASTIKSLVGNDMISANRKNKEHIMFKNQAKLFVIENKGIHTKEVSEDFFDKSLIIPFNGVDFPFDKTIHGDNSLPYSDDIIGRTDNEIEIHHRDENMLSQFLNYIAEGYRKILAKIKNGSGFTITESMEIAMFSDQKRANPIGGFLCETVDVPSINPNDKYVSVEELYKEMIHRTGKSMDKQLFGECVHEKFPDVIRKLHRLKKGDFGFREDLDSGEKVEQRSYAYFGIYWKESSMREVERIQSELEKGKTKKAMDEIEKSYHAAKTASSMNVENCSQLNLGQNIVGKIIEYPVRLD
jgi:phage/plasmid-associated DNA primase